ncbi:patatin-like protein [Stappia indica]|uniref:patatin-like protein n=1 Tax=Stappia indica TaxID=538381 RepID=UPI001CD3E4FB|nr:patatin-like protein [Stappia indica]MCA1300341.1 patatin-like protein [Stappia indica]
MLQTVSSAAQMKQVEVRLALVLYGGVSLAVYMHGVSREFLNIVRASRRLEQSADLEPGSCIEAYAHVLKLFRPELDLRVVVDVISGASAGGVNGVMLARALAHDLSLDRHRDLWLENADVTRLANEPVGLTRYLKSSIAPVLDRLVSMGLKSELTDSETRTKLRQFMQARWFTPPFSGERYVGWMLDAARQMESEDKDAAEARDCPPTLIPQGQSLDLFVTLTDFHGARRRFEIDDPPEVEETEHRLILHFGATCRGGGELQSQLSDREIPDLVFAARATSAFPGAFPPMTLGEMDRVMALRGAAWAGRGAFVARALSVPGHAPENRVFVDGSVVMNKPFQPVLDAINGRPAAREVVRKVIYVDPLIPEPEADEAAVEAEEAETLTQIANGEPGFFRVILASLAHIPRNEPIGDALDQVQDYNREIRQLSDVIAAAEPVVEREVGAILRPVIDQPMTMRELSRCRVMANERAHSAAGYAYLGYQRLKLASIAESLGGLLGRLRGPEKRSRLSTLALTRRINALHNRLLAGARANGAQGYYPELSSEPVISFLRGLDVDYRIRRLRFVISRLNRLYRSASPEADTEPKEMDELKSTLYEQIDHLLMRWSPSFYGQETVAALERVLASEPTDPAADDPELEALLAGLATRMGLGDLDRLADDVFSVMAYNYLPPRLRMSLVSAYIGFAYYDLVTLPVSQRQDVTEINEIRVDRISPNDAHILRPHGVRLKGRNLNAFGAFFNRRWREHDYLWGRLGAADRLITMTLRAARGMSAPDPEAVRKARRKLLLAILREEEPHLLADPELVPDLIQEVEAALDTVEPE